MSEKLQNVIAGAGSYVALIVMVWFAMSDAPAWLVLFAGIGNGVLFALVLGLIVPFLISGYQVLMLLHEMHTGTSTKPNVEMMEAYMAYVYEQAKLSDMRKGTD